MATNPRLVKEADALVSAGHDVHVIAARRADWADASDAELLAGRAWTSEILEWRRRPDGSRVWKAALRHRIAKLTADLPLGDGWLASGVSPVARDLTRAALARRADLYVAHNLGALPAAAAAAAKYDARVGFDAEDYHSGQFVDQDSSECRIARRLEERFIPRCSYVTASAPGIASRYQPLCRGQAPTVILNVFPAADRPSAPASTRAPGPLRLYWFSQTIGRDRGLEDAVTAMGLLTGIDIELHVRGEWQADYERHLRGHARKNGVPDARIVAHAPAPAHSMVRLAGAYDVGLTLEPGESINSDLALSNKLFTYLLAGLPVLATATRGQMQCAQALGDACRLVPPRDGSALADALRTWVERPAARAAAARAAWDLATREYNWEVEQQKFLSVVDRVVSR